MGNCRLSGEGLNKLTKLKKLKLSGGGLEEYTQMNIPSLVKLEFRETLSCIELLDVSGLPALTTLEVSTGEADYFDGEKAQIKSVDVSKNKKLTYLSCGDNKLRKLDLSKQRQLGYLSCGKNRIRVLDLRKQSKLSFIELSGNELKKVIIHKKASVYVKKELRSKRKKEGFHLQIDS